MIPLPGRPLVCYHLHLDLSGAKSLPSHCSPEADPNSSAPAPSLGQEGILRTNHAFFSTVKARKAPHLCPAQRPVLTPEPIALQSAPLQAVFKMSAPALRPPQPHSVQGGSAPSRHHGHHLEGRTWLGPSFPAPPCPPGRTQAAQSEASIAGSSL